MKRWAICRMKEYEPGSIDAAFSQYPGVRYRLWDKPGFGWAFAHIATNNLAQFDGDPDIRILPDATLDAAWSTLPLATRNAVRTQVEAAGFVTTEFKNTWTIRQILLNLAQQLQAGINIEAGDVQDVE